MNVLQAKLQEVNSFLSQPPKMYKFKASDIQLQDENQISNFVNNRLEMEAYVAKQRLNRQALEEYNLAKEQAQIELQQQIEAEKRRIQLKNDALIQNRKHTQEILEEQKGKILEQYKQQLQEKQNIQLSQSLIKRTNDEIDEQSKEYINQLQEEQCITKDLLNELLLIQLNPDNNKITQHNYEDKITMVPSTNEQLQQQLSKEDFDAIEKVLNYCITGAINKQLQQ